MGHLDPLGATFTTKSEGIGDTEVTAMYTLLGNPRGNGHRLLLKGGLSLPTGAIDKTFAHGGLPPAHLEYPMQLGSGTFDLLPEGVFDTTAALRRLGSNRGLYDKLLNSFQSHHAGAVTELRHLIATHGWSEAGRAAHTLKSIAGNLGAMALSHHAGEFEAALRAGQRDSFESLLTTLDASLTASLRAMAPSSPGHAAATGKATGPGAFAEIDPASLRPLAPFLDRLEELLKTDDFAALQYLDEVAQQATGTGWAEFIEVLRKQINRYDFEKALEQLQKLRNAPPPPSSVM